MALSTIAQQPKINKIKEVKSLNIYGGNNKTTIGKIIVNEPLESQLSLTWSLQTKDSSGKYRTEFLFKNPESKPTFGVQMDFNFDKPCDTAYSTWGGYGMIRGHLYGFLGDKNNFRIMVSQLDPDCDVRLIVISKYPLFTRVSGVKGIIKH